MGKKLPLHLWMGVRPGPVITRILLETLAESIALWCGQPLYVALGVADGDALCGSPGWHCTIEAMTRSPLVTIIDPVFGRPRPPRRRADGLGGLRDFADVRQLRLWEPLS